MQYIIDQLRGNPTLAVFLVLAIGFWFGNLKFGKFSLGVVTSTLLAGVLLGQLNITVAADVKSIFFLMFLFAVGYEVGPQFFQGLKNDGIKQILFAIVQCVACLLCAWLAGRVLHYNAGSTAGLLSGSSTISAVLGVATDTINNLGITAAEKKHLLDSMPVAYAVTYIFGTAGSAWIIATLGPKILRTNLAEDCKKLEASLGATELPPDVQNAYAQYIARAYATPAAYFGKRVLDIEQAYAPARIFIERIRANGKIIEATPDAIVPEKSVIALYGTRPAIIEHERILGPEIDDKELLSYQNETLDVVVTNRAFGDKTLAQIAATAPVEHPNGRGLFIRKIVRAGREIPRIDGITIHRGDTLTLVGRRADIDFAATALGYADRTTDKTDVSLMCIAIVVGALIGTLTLKFGTIPISLSTSGGALIAGILCGWLRSTHRTFGRIPAPAIWVFNNIGLNAFIAVVGLSAGPAFIAGLKANGLTLLLAGIFVTTAPLIIGMLAGKYIFKMHPGITLGAVAGARTTTAALGAVEEVAKSKVPSLGYTVTYAVGNTLLTIWGMVIVLMSS